MTRPRPQDHHGIARALQVLRRLTHDEFTVIRLARIYGVSKQAIERDLSNLVRAGYPVTKRKSERHAQLTLWSCDVDALWKVLTDRPQRPRRTPPDPSVPPCQRQDI